MKALQDQPNIEKNIENENNTRKNPNPIPNRGQKYEKERKEERIIFDLHLGKYENSSRHQLNREKK